MNVVQEHLECIITTLLRNNYHFILLYLVLFSFLKQTGSSNTHTETTHTTHTHSSAWVSALWLSRKIYVGIIKWLWHLGIFWPSVLLTCITDPFGLLFSTSTMGHMETEDTGHSFVFLHNHFNSWLCISVKLQTNRFWMFLRVSALRSCCPCWAVITIMVNK